MFFEFILFSPCNLSEIIVYCESTNLSIYEVENGCKLQKIIQTADWPRDEKQGARRKGGNQPGNARKNEKRLHIEFYSLAQELEW